MIPSSAGGIPGLSFPGEAGGKLRMALKMAAEVLPGKGRRPVAIS
jgi:hypothetical protein